MTTIKSAFRSARTISRAPLVVLAARAVAGAAVLGAVSLNISHTLAANASAGVLQASSLALIFGAIGLGGAVAAHLLIETRGGLNRLFCATALTIAVAVCIVVSVGAQSSGRADNVARRGSDATDRASLEARRRDLAGELAAMPPTRTEPEIRAAMTRIEIDPIMLRRTNHCQPDQITREDSRKACQPLVELHAENARAKRKPDLARELDEVSGKLAAMPPASGAGDAQADNLAWLLSLVGWKITSADVGRALNVGLAALIELFAALSAALAAIAEGAARRRDVVEQIEPAPVLTTPPVAPKAPAAPSATRERHNDIDAAIVAHVRTAGGRIAATHRVLAAALGYPSSSTSAAVRRLVEAGTLRNPPGVIEIVGGARLRAVG